MRRPSPRARPVLAIVVAVALCLIAGGCASSGSTPASPGDRVLQVAAAENFWGSIASQLGGSRVRVTSIITNPSTDPHSYEPTASDARTVASARYVLYNGIGYDPWAPKLLDAARQPGRVVLNVGDLVGVKDGGNPHRWYSPSDVARVIDRITVDYMRLDPAHASYFDQRRTAFITIGLAHYHSLISDIKARYAGVPVGASESIFPPLAAALSLDLVTPSSFLTAISEGTEPSAADKVTIDAQIRSRQIKVYVFNSQNSTPDVHAQVDEAKAAGIAITAITETLAPASASFQAWQVAQLGALESALSRGTGR
jgi:zinc/manganese transport system substrate-binding protein